MPRVVWNDVGKKRYEAGVDRGVLYLPDGSGVPWNGLISVEEDLSGVAVKVFTSTALSIFRQELQVTIPVVSTLTLILMSLSNSMELKRLTTGYA